MKLYVLLTCKVKKQQQCEKWTFVIHLMLSTVVRLVPVSHFTHEWNELTLEGGRTTHCTDCRQRTYLSSLHLPPCLFLPILPHFCFYSPHSLSILTIAVRISMVFNFWNGVLHYAIVLPLPTSLTQHPPFLPRSLSLTRPDINDTAIWGSSSSPALSPSCRLRSYTHSQTNRILDTHSYIYYTYRQLHTGTQSTIHTHREVILEVVFPLYTLNSQFTNITQKNEDNCAWYLCHPPAYSHLGAAHQLGSGLPRQLTPEMGH